MKKSNLLIEIAFTAAALKTAHASTSSPTETPTPTHPCGRVAEAWAAQYSSSPSATPTAAPSVAYECLNSIPLYKDAAIQFIDEIKPYMEYQSDIAFKRDPPSDYSYSGYDIFEELDRIRSKIRSGYYANEYEWQLDFYLSVVGKGHDYHMNIYPDLLARAVEFARPLSLVSISEDGSSLPVIKVYEDIASSIENASTVNRINEEDAALYLENLVRLTSTHQDIDAGYNTMFFEKAFLAEYGNKGYFESLGRNRYIYPGPTTNLTFANGTTVEFDNIARLNFDWDGVTDSESFVKKFMPGIGMRNGALPAPPEVKARAAKTQDEAAAASPSEEPAPTRVPGYPEPVNMLDGFEVAGYFLDAPGFESVAVLAILSFESLGVGAEFQKVVQDFFAECVKTGKTKLIVDLQSNGGGEILQGYDTFRQIFPDIVQQGLERWRFHSGFEAFSKAVSKQCADNNPSDPDNSSDLDWECGFVFNWRSDHNMTNQDFLSYEDKFTPVETKGDKYTQLTQWNLENAGTVYGFGNDITGYGKRKNFTRPFSGPEDIVLLYDGYCASTCTIFSRFMKHDAGVKSIAMGGRPTEGLIQGVGGIKGTNIQKFADIYDYGKVVLEGTNDTEVHKQLGRYTGYADSRCDSTGLNVRDAILRENVEDGTPSQFVREESDCRLYWTKDMVMDVEEIWKAAANAAFKGGKCVAGGIDY